ncbi:MAG: L-aspartate oxidase [Opitutales bacterium]|nr:L-aspartate oxidase [Opitutales bacterium]MCH8539240.1 L-aspartate oxidase [Opitutales bacterium]
MSKTKVYDVLVLGSGIAGLSFALKLAAKGCQVAILTKKDQAESNTNYAQGGIACVTSPEDDVRSHIEDTLVAGDGLCDEAVVEQIVKEGPPRVRELIDFGLSFTADPEGQPSLGREGGHSQRRILHVKDITGRAIEQALLAQIEREAKVTVFEHTLAIDIITRNKLEGKPSHLHPSSNQVVGCYALDVRSGEVNVFQAPVIMLATGGAGLVYQYTSNPDIATGDGVAMAWRVGVPVQNMEFVQFHPTTLFNDSDKRFLISEAVRGEGAILRNMAGEAFMEKYHPLKDLAPRDVVARAIDSEMKRTGSRHAWLDITHHSSESLRKRFPQIFTQCQKSGFDIGKDWIPVVPAAHYVCGGVATNLDAETVLPGLYACGEVACTGLHGANRLASNSLLEALVLADRGAKAVDKYLANVPPVCEPIRAWVDYGGHSEDERVVLLHNWEELRRTMWDYVGIVRSTRRLTRARTRIRNLAREIQEYYWNFSVDPTLLELRNLVVVADLIIECALQRNESRGLHYTIDYPRKKEISENSEVVKT